jgi:hypothetical protein
MYRTVKINLKFRQKYRLKKREPLDMIPMNMAEENRQFIVPVPFYSFSVQNVKSQCPDTSSGIKDNSLAFTIKLNTTRVSSIL